MRVEVMLSTPDRQQQQSDLAENFMYVEKQLPQIADQNSLTYMHLSWFNSPQCSTIYAN